MKQYLFLIGLIFYFLTACQNKTIQKSEVNQMVKNAMEEMQGHDIKKSGDGVLIHLSHGSDQPMRVIMALNMAKIMAEKNNVLLFLDLKGVETVINPLPEWKENHSLSSNELIKQLLEMKVKIAVCPMSLEALGKTEKDIYEGVVLLDQKALFNFNSGRVISLDY